MRTKKIATRKSTAVDKLFLSCLVAISLGGVARATELPDVVVKNNCTKSVSIGLSYSPNGTARVVEGSEIGWELKPNEQAVLASETMDQYRSADHRITHHIRQNLLVQIDEGDWKPVRLAPAGVVPDYTGEYRRRVKFTLCGP